jgi:hypothetical protein
MLPDTFPSQATSEIKRSALSALLRGVSALHTNLVVSGTGLGIESCFTILASSIGISRMLPRLVGITTIFSTEALEVAIKVRGYLETVEHHTLARFAGRPRFGMLLLEALLMEGDAGIQTVANTIVRTLQANMNCLQRVEPGAKSLYAELRNAAMRWVLKGEGSIMFGGEVALEAGVCALRVKLGAPALHERNHSWFVINEALVVEAFSKLPTTEFESLTNEGASQIGLMFEDYLAWNSQALISVLSFANKLGEEGAKYQGQWTVATPGGDGRRGVQALNDNEPRLILEMVERPDPRGPSLIFPGTAMGADLIVVARNDSSGERLLMFVQAKARMSASTEEAMRSLQYPYHINREHNKKKPRSIPEWNQAAAHQLGALLARENVRVVLLVIKFPANSAKSYSLIKLGSITLPNDVKQEALELVVDGRNGEEWLYPLHDGLKRMKLVKEAHPQSFLDDADDDA